MNTESAREPLLHIVIPTFRRAAKLERLLASLVQQGYGTSSEVRITVSENGGSAEADEVVARWRGRLPVSYIRQPAPLGYLLHLAYCYALAAGTYCWEIGDDDIIIDVPWTLLREKLAAGDLDALLLGHDFVDGQGKCHHDPGHEHLLSEQHKYKGDCLDLVCSSPSTFTLISVVILRTSRLKEHLGRSNAGGGYFPLELLMRVAEGGRGEYWPGDRVRGDLDMSWGPMADRFMYHDLPEMLARLARELPSKPVNAAIVAIFRDRYVPWKYLVMHDRHFADWFYRRHGPAIEEGLRLSGGDRAIDELRRHQSLWGQLKSFLALVSFKLRRWTRTHFFSKRFSPESAK